MLGMVPGIDTSLLEVWFDSETGFQGLWATVLYQNIKGKDPNIKASINHGFKTFLRLSEHGFMQGGPWISENHNFEHIHLILKSFIIKTS
jgi:hypothetical protein